MHLLHRRHRPALLMLVGAALIAGISITWNGINHHYDAAWYLVYARGVQAGDGFSVPISGTTTPHTIGYINQWPPLYPLVIALFYGVDLLVAARVLSIALLIAVVLLTYELALHVTDHQRGWSVAAALLALSIPALTREGFSYARSETLFTVLGLVFLRLMLRSDQRGWLWAAFTVVLLTLTRYVGVAFAALGVAWALATRRWQALIAFGLSLVPLGLYALYLLALTGSLTGTQTTADQFSLAGVPQGIRTVTIEMLHGLTFAFQLVGLRSNLWGLGAGALLMGMIAGWAVRSPNRLRDLRDHAHLLLVGYVISYSVVFWVLGSRSEIITEGTERHYVAIFPVLAVLIISALSRINGSRPLLIGVLVLYTVSGAASWQVPAAGMSYNRADWRSDPLIHSLADTLPPSTLVHTQYTSYLSYLLGRRTPVRTFGTIGAYETFACDELVYPKPYTHAAFTLIDAAYLRLTDSTTVEAFMREWAAPCGTVVDYANNGFALVMTVELTPEDDNT